MIYTMLCSRDKLQNIKCKNSSYLGGILGDKIL